MSVQGSQKPKLPMSSKTRAYGDILFPKISLLEPTLAGKITGMLLEIPEKDVIRLIRDERALRANVQEAKDVYLKYCMAKNDEECDSDDEILLTPSSSDGESVHLTAPEEPIEDEPSEDDEKFWNNSGSDSSSLDPTLVTTLRPGRLTTVDAQADEDGDIVPTVRSPADPDAMKDPKTELLQSALSHKRGEEFVETTRDPAELDTMKEVIVGSATHPRQEEPDEIARLQDITERLRQVIRDLRDLREPIRASAIPLARNDTAEQGRQIAETGTRVSMPPTTEPRHPEPARREKQRPGRRDPVSAGQQAHTTLSYELSAFFAGMSLAFWIVWIVSVMGW